MSSVQLNFQSRKELETRVLAAALKQSCISGDAEGAQLAHRQLSAILEEQRSRARANPPMNSTWVTESFRSKQSPANLIKEEQSNKPGPAGKPEYVDSKLESQKTSDHRGHSTPESATTASSLPASDRAIAQAAAQKGKNAERSAGSEIEVVEESRTIHGAKGKDKNASKKDGAMGQAFAKIGQIESDQTSDYRALYKLLGVSQISSFGDIHISFLRLNRHHLQRLAATKRQGRQELLTSLRRIWVAHDILSDPVTRTDYDLRYLGLRGDSDSSANSESEDKQEGAETKLRIGELLQCAGLLEGTELDIACDMHKAMPEVQFGTFLVKQGFIGERDLESVLVGQQLLRAGNISIAQFQVAMELAHSGGRGIRDTLIEKAYVAEALFSTGEQSALKPKSPEDKSEKSAKITLDPERTNEINIANASPSWRDQLDWETNDNDSVISNAEVGFFSHIPEPSVMFDSDQEKTSPDKRSFTGEKEDTNGETDSSQQD
jgi:hypothetical protein